MDPVKGEVWDLVHERKGRMQVRVLSSKGEWLQVETVRRVEGLSEDWEPGEGMTLRRSMVRLVGRVDRPKEEV